MELFGLPSRLRPVICYFPLFMRLSTASAFASVGARAGCSTPLSGVCLEPVAQLEIRLEHGVNLVVAELLGGWGGRCDPRPYSVRRT